MEVKFEGDEGLGSEEGDDVVEGSCDTLRRGATPVKDRSQRLQKVNLVVIGKCDVID